MNSRSKKQRGNRRNNPQKNLPVLGTTNQPGSRKNMRITPIQGGFRIINSETRVNVDAVTTASRSVHALSPHSFPWLKSLGGGFTHYKYKKCRIWYRPLSPTTSPGIVYMNIVRDYDDAKLWETQGGSASDLLVTRESLSAPAWGGQGALYFDVDCNQSRLNRYFNYTTSLPGDKLADAFELVLCMYTQDSSATSAATVLGRVEIEYEIEFTSPVAPTMNA